jgi:hypothetical protein
MNDDDKVPWWVEVLVWVVVVLAGLAALRRLLS